MLGAEALKCRNLKSIHAEMDLSCILIAVQNDSEVLKTSLPFYAPKTFLPIFLNA